MKTRLKKIKALVICLIILITGCHENRTCAVFYIGEFKIDTTYLRPELINLVKGKQWDEVILSSNKNGMYTIKTEDRMLKDCDGSWWVQSDNLEGECIGYIK
jgi:hypothetical protein